mgnify:CR=1 FL=1
MLFAKELKKLLALLTLISFLLSSVAFAQENEGRFTRVLEGAPVPFTSWCFDDVASAKLQTAIEFATKRCDLIAEQAVSEVTARYSLQIQTLNLRVESLKKESEAILKIKNQEISKLEEAALKRPNDYSLWWASGGVVVGIVTTILVAVAIE